MTKPLIKIVNSETGEIVERQMTNVEFKQYEADEAVRVARIAEAEAKAQAKQAILDRIGLTAEELQTILG